MINEELVQQIEQALTDLKEGDKAAAKWLSAILGDRIEVGNIEKSHAVAIGHNARVIVKVYKPLVVKVNKPSAVKVNKPSAVKVNKPSVVEVSKLPKRLINQLTKLAEQLDLYLWRSDLRPYLRQVYQNATQSGLLSTLDPRTNDPALAGKQITVDQVYTPLDTTTSPMSSMQAANQFNRLVVLGDPGSGKSTFVSFLTMALSGCILAPDDGWLEKLHKQGWLHSPLLPVHIALRDFAQDMGAQELHGTTQSLLDHIGRQVAYSGSNPDALDAIRYALSEGTVLLILDGLDEVPPESREAVRDTVIRTMQSFQDSRLLVTCRILSYATRDWQIAGAQTVTLAPFDRNKTEHFVRAWYAASQAVGSIDWLTAKARIADLSAAIDDPRLRNMAANPMLLTVMAIVHSQRGALPRETARLYQACVEILMFKWKPGAARHLREALDLLDENDLYRILWEIAYQAHERQGDRAGAADIPKSEVMEIAAEHYLGGKYGKAQIFCDYVEERAGLLIGRGGQDDRQRVYAFPHRTFQEFLAGCHLADNLEFASLLDEKARAGANWRQVVLLAAGHMYFNKMDRNQPLLATEYMLQNEPFDNKGWQAVTLAVEILLLIGLPALENHRLGPMLITLARTRLAELVSGGHLEPLERAAAGRTLATLGDPRPSVGLKDGMPDIDWVDIPGVRDWTMVTNEGKNGPFDIAPFQLARYPVTFAQFQAFIDDPKGRGNPRWWQELYSLDNDRSAPDERHFKYDNHPRENVVWMDAMAFCAWLSARMSQPTLVEWLEDGNAWQNYPGVRLPAEWEWQWAAQGADGREYPYEGAFDPAKGNTDETGIRQISAVGLFPQGASAYGVLDMSGNVWEWCLNEDSHLEECGPGGREARALRGGSWYYFGGLARASVRFRFSPGMRIIGLGFRLARSLISS